MRRYMAVLLHYEIYAALEHYRVRAVLSFSWLCVHFHDRYLLTNQAITSITRGKCTRYT